MNRDYIVLQVRLKSTRLPKKLLYKLQGITILEHILLRLINAKKPDGVVVATTENTIPSINKILKKYDVEVIIGPEEDVLKRYTIAIGKYGIDNVIRATGDNPLVCISYIDKALELHHKGKVDLTTFPQLPYGTGIEVISASALMESDGLAKEPEEREHITQYIYRHEKRYKILKAIPEEEFRLPKLRLTVDTFDDYKIMENIYNALWRGKPILLKDVIDYLYG